MPEYFRRIEAIYHQSLRHVGEARSAFLRQACANDDVLRHEVERLLQQSESQHVFLDEQALGVAAQLINDTEHTEWIGRRLGSYQVHARIGAGGMGVVYRAHDTRLGRDVALKVLPREFTGDPERLARFEREARILASLNHPNIAAIYGLEDLAPIASAGPQSALVLELVQGDTLEERIRTIHRRGSGGLPIDDALTLARQIADALDAAHEKGIIHRDLKPANIKITSEGVVKILDFGLAKLAPSIHSDQGAGDGAPTRTLSGTREGLIVGTPAYMSPEQSRGQAIDRRTDIWAFGCVIYEMLTGRPAFHGETLSDTIVAILERDADWTRLPVGTPSSVRRLLRRCLEKDPRRRLRDIGDARDWMEDLSTGTASAVVTSVSAAPRRRVAWLLGGVALASASFASWWLWISPSQTPAQSVQFQRLTDFVGMEESPAISPDGKFVAFVARVGGRRQIWLKVSAGGAPRQISIDDVDHEHPRWVPDSSALIYYVPSATPGEHGTLWEIDTLGGEPRRVARSISGGDISHDGRRIALFRFDGAQIVLAIVTRDGSAPDQLKPQPPGNIYEYPRWSPDDRWIAYEQDNLGHGFDERVFLVPAAPGGEAREIARSADLKGVSWLPSGSGVVYSSSSAGSVLYPPTFNLKAVERDGTGDRQLTFDDVSYLEPDVHPSGSLTASRRRMQSDIWKFPVSGSPVENTRNSLRITHQTGQAQTPSVSPDESEVVYLSDNGGHGNLWIARTDGSSVRQLTVERDPTISVGAPLWSPAGNQIVFIVTRPGTTGLWMINRDGSDLRQLVPVGYSAAWSADGRWLYYSRNTGETICIEKTAIEGGPAISIRCDNNNSTAPNADGSGLYFSRLLIKTNGIVDHEIARAHRENGPFEVMTHVSGSRVVVSRRHLVPVLSPDGEWLTMPLSDGATSNIWKLPTKGGPMLPLTAFDDRSIVIARSVSWSRDSKSLYAAVADTDADIVLLDGLLR